MNWYETLMLCKEPHPVCSQCDIDKKLSCKWYQGKHYDQTMYDAKTHMKEAKWYRK